MITMMITKMASVMKIKGNDGSEDSIKSKKAMTAPKILASKSTTILKTKNLIMMSTTTTTMMTMTANDDDDFDVVDDDDDDNDGVNNTDMVITMITKTTGPKKTSLTMICCY